MDELLLPSVRALRDRINAQIEAIDAPHRWRRHDRLMMIFAAVFLAAQVIRAALHLLA